MNDKSQRFDDIVARANMHIAKAAEHENDWVEPASLTRSRFSDEVFCESCGTEIPWHNISCRLLKNAHTNRKVKCSWCEETHVVGEDMREHNTTQHMPELIKAGLVKGPVE